MVKVKDKLDEALAKLKKPKPYFIGTLKLEEVIPGEEWMLLDPLSFVRKNGAIYTAEELFHTDGASIPKWLWSLVGGPLSGKYAKSAVIHDKLCRSGIVPRKKADKIFLEAMKADGVAFWKRRAMYMAVRAYSMWVRGKKDKSNG